LFIPCGLKTKGRLARFVQGYFVTSIEGENIMAVPKKRTSKSKKNLRNTVWKKKAEVEAKKAFSKAKSTLKTVNT
jgi:large subunit ribosomal protein L32